MYVKSGSTSISYYTTTDIRYDMSKYKIANEFGSMEPEPTILGFIANELAESNRLHRLEIS